MLIIDLYFLIYAAIAQIFNPIAKPVIPTGVPNKEEKTDMETHPVIVEPKIRKHSRQFKGCANFLLLFTHQFISIYFFN